jgi:hypothetical protein
VTHRNLIAYKLVHKSRRNLWEYLGRTVDRTGKDEPWAFALCLLVSVTRPSNDQLGNYRLEPFFPNGPRTVIHYA